MKEDSVTIVTIRFKNHPEHTLTMRRLINYCLQRSSAANHHIGERECLDRMEYVFQIQFYNTGLLGFVGLLYDHKYFPFSDFSAITSTDYTISFEGSTFNPLIELVRNKENEIADRRFNIIDMVVSENSDHVEKLEKRIASLESYMKKSGIIHYEGFMNQFLDSMASEGIIKNPEYIKERMFPKVQ